MTNLLETKIIRLQTKINEKEVEKTMKKWAGDEDIEINPHSFKEIKKELSKLS